jgi:hypothetical protein
MEKLFKESYSFRSLIVAAFVGMIATFAVLEYHGKIEHSQEKEDFVIADYKGIMLQPGESHQLSKKKNNQLATCHEGLLVIESNDGSNLKALIVDYKNRTVSCNL